MFENILSSIEFQMSLLLFVALAGYLLASKINQSAIVCIIILGIIIGPSFLNLITYTDFVRSIAQLGAVILLFVIGLEFKVTEIYKWKYGIIAFACVILSWIGGYFVSSFFGYSFATCVFVGTALTATSVAITANVLREMGKLKTEVAKAIIGAAVVDDIIGLLVLSTSQQMVSGSISFIPILIIFIKAILFVVLGTIIGSKYLSKLLKMLDKSKLAKKFPQVIFICAMMFAFLYAMIAESIQLSGIIGAFIAGIALEGVVIKHGKDYKQGAEYLQIIFASIFFISLGIIADLRVLSKEVMLFLIVLIIVAVLTKLIGSFVVAKMQGMTSKESLIIGFGMSPRGEVAMIVALIGLNAGIIKQDIYVSLVLMSLVTTLITPIIMRRLFSKMKLSKSQ